MNQVVIKIIGIYSYQTTHCLGQGVYGKVYEGMDRQTKEKVAVKKIDLNIFTNDKYLENAIFSQIYMLKRFNHPNIVKFKDVLSSKSSLYIITQYCRHGDLKQLIIKKKKFKQQQAFEVIKQILCGFTQLVQEKIVHRDLKPANILIHDDIYKIADFGFAKYVDNFGTQMLKSCVGSPIYMAPQILQRGSYTTKCDIWSIGIIFFEMITGSPPYKARDQNQLLRNLKNFNLEQTLFRQNFTIKQKEFLRKCLAYREQERASWNQLFEIYLYNNKPIQQQPPIHNVSYFEYPQQQRTRFISSPSSTIGNNLSSNLSNASSNINNISNNNITIINASQYLKKDQPATVIANRYTANIIQPKYSYGNGGINYLSNNTSIPSISVDNLNLIKNNRDDCIYKNFICHELYLSQSNLKSLFQESYRLQKLIYILINSIRIRSTYNLSVFNLYFKGNKLYEDIQKKLEKENQYYLQLQNQINNYLQSQQSLKRIRDEVSYIIGNKTDIINQDKIQKVENLLLKIVQQYSKIITIQVRKRNKYPQQSIIIQYFEWLYDIILLITKKQKGKSELSMHQKYEQFGSIQYFLNLISKIENISQEI